MRLSGLFGLCTTMAMMLGAGTTALAQTADPETRQSILASAAAEKAKSLEPYDVTIAEKVITRLEAAYTGGTIRWHPFLQNAYHGSGFAAGLGYLFHTSAYTTLDVRGSYSMNSSKLAEAELTVPRLFDRRADLKVLGGWRDATQVSFYGVGPNTSSSNASNYAFQQPFGSALLTVRPTRRLFLVRGGFEVSRWDIKSGQGTSSSVDEVYTPQSLPGLGAATTFLHSQATVGFDSREASGYARRGGFYAVTAHDYTDRDDALGSREVDYEAIQHIPILRESWVISLHGLATMTYDKSNQASPFYMLPSLGGGSTLRGFSSGRFTDRNSLLLQAEWRIMANRFLDSAVFYDAGKVAARRSDLDLHDLKSDYGFGVRFHAPMATVLRIDVARSNEGFRLVFAASPVF